MTPVEIYMGERYYGTIRMAIATAPFTTREANTIGSKCSDIEIARHVVDIKAEIEQRLPRLKKTKYTIKIL